MISNLRWWQLGRNPDVKNLKKKKKKDSWLAKYSTILTCWCLQLINPWVLAPTILPCSVNTTWAGTPITRKVVLVWAKLSSIQWIRWQSNLFSRNSNNLELSNRVISRYSKQLKKINQKTKTEWSSKTSSATPNTATTMHLTTRKAKSVAPSTQAENSTSLKVRNPL